MTTFERENRIREAQDQLAFSISQLCISMDLRDPDAATRFWSNRIASFRREIARLNERIMEPC